MTKHTEGPWTISKRNAKAGYVSIDGVGHTALALVVWQMDYEQYSPGCEANAHLIKAAPELLEALEDMLAACPAVDEYGYKARRKARAAIAKTKG